MKKKFLLAFIPIATAGISQTLKPDVIASSGGCGTSAQGSLCWTIGEPMNATFKSSNNCLTQGFLQPSITVTAVNDLKSITDLEVAVFPNPTSEAVTIKTNADEIFTLAIYSANGSLMSNYGRVVNEATIDFANYPAGMYLLKMYNKKNLVKTFQIVKQ